MNNLDPKRKLTFEEKYCIAEHAKKHPVERTSEVFNLSEKRIRIIRYCFGTRRPGRKNRVIPTERRIKQSERLEIAQYSRIYTSLATAQKFKIAPSTVRKIRMEFGLEKKKPGPCTTA